MIINKLETHYKYGKLPFRLLGILRFPVLSVHSFITKWVIEFCHKLS